MRKIHPLMLVSPQAKSYDGDSSTGTLSEGAVVRTLEKAARSTADAMAGLEDALKRVLGSSSGIDAAVRDGLMKALRNEAREGASIGVSTVKGKKSGNVFLQGGGRILLIVVIYQNQIRFVLLQGAINN